MTEPGARRPLLIDTDTASDDAAPLERALFTAEFVHGQDGMGDIGLPLSGRVPDARVVIEASRDRFLELLHARLRP